MTEDHLTLLRESELFQGVDDDCLGAIRGGLTEVRLSAGATLFARAELGDAVYVVVNGTLALEVDGVTVMLRRSGECVGEFALIDDRPRSTDARALTDVVLLRWEREDFHIAMEHEPAIARAVFRMLTGKLRDDVDNKVRLQLAHERWSQDLARAQEIQQGMLPADVMTMDGLELAGYCAPAREVGGDYYDYLPLPGKRLGVLITDVTGHGFYSGLFVAMAKTSLHARALDATSPVAVLRSLRLTLDLSLQGRLYMSCCYLVVDCEQRRVRYGNAGHPPMLLRRGSTRRVERFDALDPLLGVEAVSGPPTYQTAEITLERGDVLVLYSDGLIEARDPERAMFGLERLELCLQEAADGSAVVLRDHILAAVRGHAAGVAPGDDVTLVVLRMT